MEKLSTDAEKIMIERFGKDSIIALATTVDNKPYVRSVNSFYDKGSFYVLTYGLSNKMKQIQQNPLVAIAGDWFTANGKADTGAERDYLPQKINSRRRSAGSGFSRGGGACAGPWLRSGVCVHG